MTSIIESKYVIIKETKYLRFTKLERDPNKKTDIIVIDSISGGYTLGNIQWFPRWRQYCFFPYSDTVWNKTCMKEVYDVIEELKAKKKLES